MEAAATLANTRTRRLEKEFIFWEAEIKSRNGENISKKLEMNFAPRDQTHSEIKIKLRKVFSFKVKNVIRKVVC